MSDGTVTLDQIVTARKIVAQILVRDGPKFLPVFERLEREYERAKEQEATMARAQELAADDGRE
jgi:hypothetical protein